MCRLILRNMPLTLVPLLHIISNHSFLVYIDVSVILSVALPFVRGEQYST